MASPDGREVDVVPTSIAEVVATSHESLRRLGKMSLDELASYVGSDPKSQLEFAAAVYALAALVQPNLVEDIGATVTPPDIRAVPDEVLSEESAAVDEEVPPTEAAPLETADEDTTEQEPVEPPQAEPEKIEPPSLKNRQHYAKKLLDRTLTLEESEAFSIFANTFALPLYAKTQALLKRQGDVTKRITEARLYLEGSSLAEIAEAVSAPSSATVGVSRINVIDKIKNICSSEEMSSVFQRYLDDPELNLEEALQIAFEKYRADRGIEEQSTVAAVPQTENAAEDKQPAAAPKPYDFRESRPTELEEWQASILDALRPYVDNEVIESMHDLLCNRHPSETGPAQSAIAGLLYNHTKYATSSVEVRRLSTTQSKILNHLSGFKLVGGDRKLNLEQARKMYGADTIARDHAEFNADLCAAINLLVEHAIANGLYEQEEATEDAAQSLESIAPPELPEVPEIPISTLLAGTVLAATVEEPGEDTVREPVAEIDKQVFTHEEKKPHAAAHIPEAPNDPQANGMLDAMDLAAKHNVPVKVVRSVIAQVERDPRYKRDMARAPKRNRSHGQARHYKGEVLEAIELGILARTT